MIILSSFKLNMRSPSIRQCLYNAHDMHRSIMSGFVHTETPNAREEKGVLYRLIPGERDLSLYVMSKEYPDWSKLSEGFIPVPGSPKDINGITKSFVSGSGFRFDLLAAASKKVPRENANSRRVMLTSPEERGKWLMNKAEQHGFKILWVQRTGNQSLCSKNNGLAVHTGVKFRGNLRLLMKISFKKRFVTVSVPQSVWYGYVNAFSGKG